MRVVIVAGGVCLVLGAAAGWTANGWRLGEQIESITAAQALEREGHIALLLAEERRRAEELEGVQRNAQEEIERVAADAALAGSAAVGLRSELAASQQRLAASSRTARDCAAALTGARVYAELFSEADRFAGAVAAAADEREVRGQACEAAYGALGGQ